MKFLNYLLLLLSLIEFAYLFKLNNTFDHGFQVNKMTRVFLNSPSQSVNYLASGAKDGSIKIWNLKSLTLKYTFNSTNGGHSINSVIKLSNGNLASAR